MTQLATLLAAGLLLIPSANAFWRLPCSQPVLNSRVDPIVNPGKPSGHAHTIMGSNAIGFNTGFEDLRNSNCSTCMVKADKSAYWVPELMYQYKNGSFQPVSHGGMLVYYLQRNGGNETVEAFPDGLRMLAGNPLLRSNTNTPESQAISWLCIDFNGPAQPQTPGFTNTNCPNGLRAQVFFPGCWDGENLDSPDHKSHMAYPDGVDNGQCPSTHPHHLISLFYEVWFNVKQFNDLNDGGRFVLSNGDPTGYGLHGDFMDGWDKTVLSNAVNNCTNLSGVIEDCPVFDNGFYTPEENNACFAPNPVPGENDEPGAILANLPGCVAVTEGPAAATPADLVPGCVPGSGNATAVNGTHAGNGTATNGTNVPSSGVPSSTAASSVPSSAPFNATGTAAPAASASPAPSSASTPAPSSKGHTDAPLPSGATDAPPPSPTSVPSGSVPSVSAGNALEDPAFSSSANKASSSFIPGASSVPSSVPPSALPNASALDSATTFTSSYAANPTGSCGRRRGPGNGRRRNHVKRRHN